MSLVELQDNKLAKIIKVFGNYKNKIMTFGLVAGKLIRKKSSHGSFIVQVDNSIYVMREDVASQIMVEEI